jgi:hypothetical protein
MTNPIALQAVRPIVAGVRQAWNHFRSIALAILGVILLFDWVLQPIPTRDQLCVVEASLVALDVQSGPGLRSTHKIVLFKIAGCHGSFLERCRPPRECIRRVPGEAEFGSLTYRHF